MIKLKILLVFLLFSFPAKALFLPKVDQVNGDYGKAYLIKDDKHKIFAVTIYFKTGYVEDKIEGLSNLTVSLLDEGAGSYDSKTFQDILYDNGIEISFSSSLDSIICKMQALSEKKDLAFELLELALNSPRFEDEAILRVKDQIKAGIRISEKDPSNMALKAFKKNGFKDTKFVKSQKGTLENLDKITKEDLQEYMATRLGKDNIVIGASGDISQKELSSYLNKVFKKFPLKSVKAEENKVKLNLSKKRVNEFFDSPQSVIVFGQDGISRMDKDYYAVLLINYVLGSGGFSSRLMKEAREKQGLVYSISSWLDTDENAPLIMGYASTANENVEKTVLLIKKEWENIAKNGISEEELIKAKKYLIGSFPFKFNSSLLLSQVLASVNFYGLGLDYFLNYTKQIEKVTDKEIKEAAKRIFNEDKLLFVTIGKIREKKNADYN